MNEQASESPQQTPADTPTDPEQLFGQGCKALILEDDPTSGTLIRSLLSAHGFEVIETKTGAEAWEELLKQPPCRLVISDFLMPEMDGFQFLKKIKANPGLQDIPIVFISSRKNTEDAFLVSGADAFFSKPLETKPFIDTMKSLIKTRPAAEPSQDKTPPSS